MSSTDLPSQPTGSIVLLDACVLYPAPLRDYFIRLAHTGIILPRWKNLIHDEWIRSLLKE